MQNIVLIRSWMALFIFNQVIVYNQESKFWKINLKYKMFLSASIYTRTLDMNYNLCFSAQLLMPSVWWKICPTLSTWSKWIFIPLRYWRFTYKHQSNRHWRRFSGNYQEISQIQSSKRIWVYFVPWWHTLHSTKVLAFCEIVVEKLLSKFLVLELNLKNNELLAKPNKRKNTMITL